MALIYVERPDSLGPPEMAFLYVILYTTTDSVSYHSESLSGFYMLKLNTTHA